VFWQSAWWIISAPFYGLFALAGAIVLSGGRLKGPPRANIGIDVQTCILTAGEDKKRCTLVICKDYLAVDMHPGLGQVYRDWEAEGKPGTLSEYREEAAKGLRVPLAAITNLLYQQMTVLTGFGVDYVDGDGKGRLMFVNDGSGQAKRTRQILKAIQDACAAVGASVPVILDVSRAIKVAKDSIVHRV
jgi:hypothetical protein